MSFYYETEAIVLGSIPLAEADKIVTFLTPYYGVLKGVARGSRNPKSRFSGALELLSNVEVTFSHRERELVRIDKVEIKKSYFYLVSNPSLLPSFSFITETLISLVPQGVQEEKIYRMVEACMQASEAYPDKINLVKLYFSIWMLELSGYSPSWNFCESCKKSLIGESLFMVRSFAAVCTSCHSSNKTRSSATNALASAKALDKRHLRILHLALSLAPQAFIKAVEADLPTLPKELSEVTEGLLRSVMQA